MYIKHIRKVFEKLVRLNTFYDGKGSIYCPFHQDHNHKSAKVYEDKDGIDRIYCFVCKIQYSVFDYYLLNNTYKEAINYLRKNYSEEDIRKADNELDKDTISISEHRKIDKAIEEYKKDNDFKKYLANFYDILYINK